MIRLQIRTLTNDQVGHFKETPEIFDGHLDTYTRIDRQAESR